MIYEIGRGSGLPPSILKDKAKQKPLTDEKEIKIQKHRPVGQSSSQPWSPVGGRNVSPNAGKRLSATNKLLGSPSEKRIIDETTAQKEKGIEKVKQAKEELKGNRQEADFKRNTDIRSIKPSNLPMINE